MPLFSDALNIPPFSSFLFVFRLLVSFQQSFIFNIFSAFHDIGRRDWFQSETRNFGLCRAGVFIDYDCIRPRSLLEVAPLTTQETKPAQGEVSFPFQANYESYRDFPMCRLPSMPPKVLRGEWSNKYLLCRLYHSPNRSPCPTPWLL